MSSNKNIYNAFPQARLATQLLLELLELRIGWPLRKSSCRPEDFDPCHRKMVPELPTARVWFRPGQTLRAKTQKTLRSVTSLGLGCLHFNAASG